MAGVIAQARADRAIISNVKTNHNGKIVPTINVQLLEGRTPEQKRAFVTAVTEAAVQILACSPGAVDVIFAEVKRDNWATGGTLWSDKGE